MVDVRLTLQLAQGQALGAAEDGEAGVIGCVSPCLDSG